MDEEHKEKEEWMTLHGRGGEGRKEATDGATAESLEMPTPSWVCCPLFSSQ